MLAFAYSTMSLKDVKQAYLEYVVFHTTNAQGGCILNPPLGIAKCKLTCESFLKVKKKNLFNFVLQLNKPTHLLKRRPIWLYLLLSLNRYMS